MKSSRRGQLEEINITPLTDVFLVLLIIMMLVAPLIDLKGLDLAVLAPGPSVKTSESKQLLVEVTAAGEYLVDGKPVGRENLSNTVKELSLAKPEGVVLDANPDATHDATVFALAAINLAGIKNIGLSEMDTDTQDTTPPEGKPTEAKNTPSKKP